LREEQGGESGGGMHAYLTKEFEAASLLLRAPGSELSP
jgi:hypothetical protein